MTAKYYLTWLVAMLEQADVSDYQQTLCTLSKHLQIFLPILVRYQQTEFVISPLSFYKAFLDEIRLKALCLKALLINLNK